MEPNKIEKQFREKLNAREIQPSAQAWDRLDAMLSVAEEKKTERSPFLSFRFIGIAASVLVFVTLGTLFFNQKDTEVKPQNTVVGTETKKEGVENSVKAIPSSSIESEKQNEAVASSENHQSINNNQGVSIINKESNNQKTNANQNQIIRDKAIEFQNPSDVAIKDLPRIQDKKDIYVKVDNTKQVFIKKEGNFKTDELLLADLDKTGKSTDSKSKIKVDAKSLLSQVDGEVEQTFREKVFTKLNKNYQEIKVALANRNNE